jgi:hypothetical protein
LPIFTDRGAPLPYTLSAPNLADSANFTATEHVANGSGHPDGRIATGAQ